MQLADNIWDIDPSDLVIFARGRDKSDDGGHGIFQRVGGVYSDVENGGVRTRYGLDVIPTGSTVLFRRLDKLIVPEMFGARPLQETKNDQSAPLQRMFNCVSLRMDEFPVRFEVLNQYSLHQTLTLNEPIYPLKMTGFFLVPSDQRVTGIKVSMSGPMQFSPTVPPIEVPDVILRVEKEIKGVASWGTYKGFDGSWLYDDDQRSIYMNENCCGIEVVKANNGSHLEVNGCGGFAIGMRTKATSLGGWIGGSSFRLRGTRANKVGLMVACDNSGPTTSWNNGNYYHYEGNVGVSNQIPPYSLYGILVTALNSGVGILSAPNGNTFTGGITEAWSRNGQIDDYTGVVADRSIINWFGGPHEPYRIESYSKPSCFAFQANNTSDPSRCRGNRFHWWTPYANIRTTNNGRNYEYKQF